MSETSTPLYLWDDGRARRFEPFSLTRPAGELRAGAEIVRRRWERAAGTDATGFVAGEHLESFEEGGAPPWAASVPAGALLVNSRVVPALDARVPEDASRLTCAGRLAAVRLAWPATGEQLAAVERLEDLPAADGAEVPLAGRWIDEVWELVATLEAQLAEDVPALAAELLVAPPEGAIVIGEHPVHVEAGARVEPMVCFDVTAGPVLVRSGATIAAFSRVVGPAVLGERSAVLGGSVAVSSIGERCKVSGEVSHIVMLGHANKAHDGFVGYSYLGRWVNLGASTVTSNLKNTYGPVSVWTPAGLRNTGMQFLGTLFGDHVKTGIATVCNTGSVMGAGANVYGGAMLPKVVPPFAWGDGEPFETYDLERFLQVAERVMRRREVELGERGRMQLAAAHRARWSAGA